MIEFPFYSYAEATTWSMWLPPEMEDLKPISWSVLMSIYPRQAHCLLLSPILSYETMRQYLHESSLLQGGWRHTATIVRNPAFPLWLLEDASHGGILTAQIEQAISQGHYEKTRAEHRRAAPMWQGVRCSYCWSAEMRRLPIFLSA